MLISNSCTLDNVHTNNISIAIDYSRLVRLLVDNVRKYPSNCIHKLNTRINNQIYRYNCEKQTRLTRIS